MNTKGRMNENKIKALSSKYNLKTKMVSNIPYIYSKCDEWYITDQATCYRLYHRNKKKNNSVGKERFHVQKIYGRTTIGNLETIFQYIIRHDNYKCNLSRHEIKMNLLFDQIAQT